MNNVKKFILVLVSLFVLLFLLSCKAKVADETADESDELQSDEEDEEENGKNISDVALIIDVENQTIEEISNTTALFSAVNFTVKEEINKSKFVKIEGNNATARFSTVNFTVKEEINKSKFVNFGFEIYYPTPDFRLPGSLMSLSLSLDNFSISKQGDVKKWGYGYFLVRFDDSNVTHVMERASKTFRGFAIGKHTVYVEMVQSDGTSYGVVKSVNFEVRDRDEVKIYQ